MQSVCSLSSSVPRQFHVVKEQKNWTEAQRYCREEFTDLATINDMTENEKVKSMIHDGGVSQAWIGLKQGSSPKWQWSLADGDFYRENETEFRNWGKNQPEEGDEYCVVQDQHRGTWHDYFCKTAFPFICYNGGDSTQPYVLVTEEQNWTDAQRYCREKHTDLASVRNQAENDQIDNVRGGGDNPAWIGLFRDAWEWSDGSSSSLRLWDFREPKYDGIKNCAQVHTNGWWNKLECSDPGAFICYEAPKQMKRQRVKVELQTDSQVNVDDPVMQHAFLQQIQQRLRERGMPADTKLTWMRQPDGKIFQEKTTEKIKERDEI
ncbi:macrophage mannose receptor 1-like isoform X2 [Alosa sapidissima]|uniref:macrophage mannose receptor 1-like isoform X2 n=1 Tax=Alosa sapidissima TaxID=34773 RepID=UPI001C090BAD|nr:macrophage mannose receptor 1-like isoform X2 [Alosa sapidissima]